MDRHDYRSSITARLSPGEAIDRIGRVAVFLVSQSQA